MTSRASTVEAALLLLLAAILPFRLLAVAARIRLGHGIRDVGRSLTPLAVAVVILSATYTATSHLSPPTSAAAASELRADEERAEMRAEIDELKIMVARLESMLEQNMRILASKTIALEEGNEVIEAMEHDIQSLINDQEEIKKSLRKAPSHSGDNIKDMENEVQLLKEESKKIKNNILNMESLANEAEKKVEALMSEVQKIESIVTEQWIQVRQFEQAFIQTKIMASKVHRAAHADVNNNDWFGKFSDKAREHINDIYRADIQLIGRILNFGDKYLRSSAAQASLLFEKATPVLQEYHHQVLQFLKVAHLQYVRDNDMPNNFFLSGSISRSTISHLYKQYKRGTSLAQKLKREVQKFIRQLDWF